MTSSESTVAINKYVKLMDQCGTKNNKFKMLKLSSKFVIENVDSYDHYRQELKNCIQRMINEITKDAMTEIGGADKIGVTIKSEELKNGDVILPITTITENIAEEVMKLYIDAEQFEEITFSLYDTPFTIVITILNTSTLPIDE